MNEGAQNRAARTGEAQARRRDRIARRQVDKFAERREELAAAALRTLAEQGYARTSLRDIAQNSEFSHGVLHYYFADKIELITYCVRQYKAECVKRYDTAVAAAGSPDELGKGLSSAMAQTLREDAPMHRLWYDLRNQSMFDDRLRADVLDIDASLEAMIWRVASRYSELNSAPPRVTPPVAYALMDGLFQHALLRHLAGSAEAADDLDARVQDLLGSLVSKALYTERPVASARGTAALLRARSAHRGSGGRPPGKHSQTPPRRRSSASARIASPSASLRRSLT